MNRKGNRSKATRWTTNMMPGQRLNSWQDESSIEMQNKHPVWLDRLKCAHPQQREKFHGFGRAGAIRSGPAKTCPLFISRDQNFRIPSNLTIPCCQLYDIPPESQGWNSYKILVISPACPHKSHSGLTLTTKRRLVSLSSRIYILVSLKAGPNGDWHMSLGKAQVYHGKQDPATCI